MEQDNTDGTPITPVEPAAREKTCFITSKRSPVPESVRFLTEGCPSAALEDLPAPAALQARVLIAFASTARDYGRVAYEIRQQPGLFLKPLLILCREPSQRWATCADAEMILCPPPPVFRDAIGELDELGRRVNDFAPLDGYTRSYRLQEMLVLRYLASRDNKKIRPLANVHAQQGYDYSLPHALAAGTNKTGLGLLETLREAGLLDGRPVERVRVCPTCGDFRLNFRETCPHCGSLVFSKTTTLRHFPCSYVGTKTEFQRDGALQCPNCDRRLHRAGVDYAERGSHFRCADCHRQFDEPDTRCRCLNCSDTLSAREPEVRAFREYQITKEGELAAEAGAYPEQHVADLLRDEPGLYHPSTFQQYYQLEVARSRRYGVPGAVASLSIKNLAQQIRDSYGRGARRLASEVKQILADTFRETDILTEISRDRVLIIFTHTPPHEAHNGLARLEKNLHERAGETVEVDAELHELNGQAPVLEELRIESEEDSPPSGSL